VNDIHGFILSTIFRYSQSIHIYYSSIEGADPFRRRGAIAAVHSAGSRKD